MTSRIFSVRSWMAIAVLVVGGLALIAVSPSASAQVNNPDDAIPYPGPFDEPAADEDAATDEAPAVAAAAGDEVLSEVVIAGNSAENHDSERSIDYIDESWARPNPIASSDPGAGGSAGGGVTGGLAVTGPSVEPIVGISAGLLALGGSALVVSRRRLSDFF